jgi:NADH-ubiquinone oxidoreductase chain 6
MVFCCVTFVLLIAGIEFIAITFLIVYVGAIAVLFLFVVMMLNIKVLELDETF